MNYYTMPGIDRTARRERVDKIIGLVAQAFMLAPEILVSNNTRKRNVVMAKQMAMKLIRMYCKIPLSEIGILFNQDHTTVIHHCRKVDDLRYSDEEYDKIYLSLESLAILL